MSIENYNNDVQGWGTGTAKNINAAGKGMGITHRPTSPSPGASLPKIKSSFKYSGGLINRISFKVPRHLLYVHKGAGKGRGGTKGSRWVDKYGTPQKTNPASLGKMATGGRVEKPFINDVLNDAQGIEHLADLVASNTGDIITGNILIK